MFVCEESEKLGGRLVNMHGSGRYLQRLRPVTIEHIEIN